MNFIKSILFGGSNLTEKQEKYRKIFMYLVSGGFTTVINFLSFYLFDLLVKAEVNVSLFGSKFDLMVVLNQIIAWVLAVLAAYFTNRIFVFRSKGSIIRELLTFAGARVISFLVLELGVFSLMLWIFEGPMNIPQETIIFALGKFEFTYLYLVKILNCVFVMIANYVMSKLMVFKKEDAVTYESEDKA